jgi:hypothetical protein
MSNQVTIGADPEFFLCDSRMGGVIPAIGLLGGTKSEPVPIPALQTSFPPNPYFNVASLSKTFKGTNLGKGYTMQEDNVMAEFNIPPCKSAREFTQAVTLAKANVIAHIQASNSYLDADNRCSRLFKESLLNTPKAKEFGCSPDFDSYKNGEPWAKINMKDLAEDGGEWRFAGGHIHIGFTGRVPPFVAANLADVFLALPFVASDKQGRRRALYGQPGRYRPTSFGIEYRTLSNFWLWDMNTMYTVANQALNLGQILSSADLNKLQSQYQEIPWEDVRTAILFEDKTLAGRVLSYIRNSINLMVNY